MGAAAPLGWRHSATLTPNLRSTSTKHPAVVPATIQRESYAVGASCPVASVTVVQGLLLRASVLFDRSFQL